MKRINITKMARYKQVINVHKYYRVMADKRSEYAALYREHCVAPLQEGWVLGEHIYYYDSDMEQFLCVKFEELEEHKVLKRKIEEAKWMLVSMNENMRLQSKYLVDLEDQLAIMTKTIH